jgi:2-polyprenyl-3-methyl-5-hydroxy-6-metoxy-1,4-benzoquinol methylase
MATTIEDRRTRIGALAFDYPSQPVARVTACNLCGGSTFVTLTHRDRYHYPAEASGCRRCGLVFLNPVMTAEAYGRFYADTYRPLVSAFHGRLIDAVTIQDEQRQYAAERVAFVEPFLSGLRSGTLLDIGGSTGVVAHEFARRFGLKATVIDPSPLEAAQAQRLGIETITGLVESTDLGSQQFDLVIICQTVDHLLDIAGTLRRVRDLLRPAGRLFIDIVDLRAGYLRNWSIEDTIKIDHPYYLTEETMSAYLARSGFEVLGVDYAADHLHIGYVCRPGAAVRDALPSPSQVETLFREVRYVQNARRASNS